MLCSHVSASVLDLVRESQQDNENLRSDRKRDECKRNTGWMSESERRGDSGRESVHTPRGLQQIRT